MATAATWCGVRGFGYLVGDVGSGGSDAVSSVSAWSVLEGNVTGVSDASSSQGAGSGAGVIDLPDSYFFSSLGESTARCARSCSILDTVIGNNSNGSENTDDDDDYEEFDDGESFLFCSRNSAHGLSIAPP